MTTILGAAVLLVVLGVVVGVLVYGARPLDRALRRRPRPTPPPPKSRWEAAVQALACAHPGYVPFEPPSPHLRLVSDEELVRAWRASYALVRYTRSARQLTAAAEARRDCLDELERRDPAGFAAWLACAATPTSDPLPFFHHRSYTSPGFDWDELTRHDW